MKELVCFSDEAAIVRIFEIEVDVSRQSTTFVPNHGRTMREGDAGDLAQRDLRPGWRADQHSSHLIDVVAKISLVADVDGIALAALDIFSNVPPSDARFDRCLTIRDGEAVARGLWPINIHIHSKAFPNLFAQDQPYLPQPSNNLFTSP